MRVLQKPSPNHGPRPPGVVVNCVVLHATADSDTKASVSWCRTPKPENPNPVSYHAIVDRDGTVYQLVATDRRAWHAGVSEFRGARDVNSISVGLSFANRNDGVEPYPDVQYSVGAALVAAWIRKHPAITLDRITTHREIAPTRKTDPLGFDVVRFRTMVAAELAARTPPTL